MSILVFIRNPLSELAWTGAIWAPMVPLFLSQVSRKLVPVALPDAVPPCLCMHADDDSAAAS